MSADTTPQCELCSDLAIVQLSNGQGVECPACLRLALEGEINNQRARADFLEIARPIVDALRYAEDKHGIGNEHHPFVWMSLLVEEVGELAHDLNSSLGGDKKLVPQLPAILIEAGHVGAIVLAFIDCMTRGEWRKFVPWTTKDHKSDNWMLEQENADGQTKNRPEAGGSTGTGDPPGQG